MVGAGLSKSGKGGDDVFSPLRVPVLSRPRLRIVSKRVRQQEILGFLLN